MYFHKTDRYPCEGRGNPFNGRRTRPVLIASLRESLYPAVDVLRLNDSEPHLLDPGNLYKAIDVQQSNEMNLTCMIQEPFPANVYPACTRCLCRVKELSKLRMHCISVFICGWIRISVTRFSDANWMRRSPVKREFWFFNIWIV